MEWTEEDFRRCICSDDLPYGLLPSDALLGDYVRLMQSRNLVASRELHSRFGFVGTFVMRVLRRLTRFQVEPLVRDQNRFNLLTSTLLYDLYKRVVCVSGPGFDADAGIAADSKLGSANEDIP